MLLDISKIIKQTEIILMEHAHCEFRCLGEMQLDLEAHTRYVASIIGYYALGGKQDGI